MCVDLRKRQMVRTCIFFLYNKRQKHKKMAFVFILHRMTSGRICTFVTLAYRVTTASKFSKPFLQRAFECACILEHQQICAAGRGLMFDLLSQRVELVQHLIQCNIWIQSLASSAAAEHGVVLKNVK